MKTTRNCNSAPFAWHKFFFSAATLGFVFFLSSGVFAAENGHAGSRSIRLKARRVETLSVPSGKTAKCFPTGGPARYYIVQRSGRIDRKWREELGALSRRVVGYLPDDCLLVKASRQQLSRISGLKGARWVGRYLPEYKISPCLGTLMELRHAGVFSEGEVCPLLVSVFPGCDLSRVISQIESFGCRVESSLAGRLRSHLRISAEKSRIPAIARLDDVEWIEPFRPFVLAGGKGREARLAQPDIQVRILNAPAVWERGLTGAGQVLAICDTGLDVGVNGTPIHDDFEGRIEAAYALGRPDLWNDPDGHGTHVAGTAVGNGTLSDGEFRAPAYESRLVFQSGYVSDEDPLGGVPVNLYDLFEQVYLETPARIHSNSWGSPDRSAYSLFSTQTDEFVWEHKDFLLIFAAGNDGVDAEGDGVIDPGSLYSPATAKNCIAVGASENVRSAGGLSEYTWRLLGLLYGAWSAYPLADDLVSDNENGMAAFSSRGPCLDGRIKPDLVAPGTDIISCRSQDPQGKQATELLSWGVYNDYYVYMGGTSMAAPAVASCAAVVRQFYADVKGIGNPSAALLKATLINGAADMAPGQYGAGPQQEVPPAPNYAEGWGRVDLKQSLYPEEPAELLFVDDTEGLDTGECNTYRYVVGTSEVPFRATMVYSDYPASPAAAIALVNDLDMMVTTPNGETTYPNGKDEPDDLNNVEAVNIPSPQPGIYRVTISGTNVPEGPQPYALVVNCGGVTSRAALSLDKEVYGQEDAALAVMLIDADLESSSSASVILTSDSDPSGVTVALSPSEISPNVFQGFIELSSSSSGGPTLHVSHGDIVSVKYDDTDYGGAGSREVVDTATVDLVAPLIFGVSVSEITNDSATIAWSCSEATTGSVSYGGSPLLGSSALDRTPAESHSITLNVLSENQTYYLAVHARDAAGNTTSDDNGGQLYLFHTRYTIVRFRDDMEIGEGGWSHYGDADQWEYGFPDYGNGPQFAHSGDFCWGTRLGGYLEHDDFIFGDVRNECVVSPEISVDSSAKLTFWHWYDLLADTVFDIHDYAYVDVSTEGGDWQNVTPGPTGDYTGSSAGWVEAEIDLSPFAGERVRVRFRLRADSWFDYLGQDYQYAGWYIDDVVVSSSKPYGEATLTLSRLYCTTAVPLEVTLIDADLNLDPGIAEVTEVSGHSTTDSSSETLLLTETGPNTGVFNGNVFLDAASPVPGDGVVQVKEGDTVIISYEDVQEGALSPGNVIQASAIVDLTAPSVADLSVTAPSTDRAKVSFTTEPTAVTEIAYSGPDGQEQSQMSSRQSAHREFLLSGLVRNSLYCFRITVTDEAGNSATYSSPAGDFSFGTKAEVVVAANAFDAKSSDWGFSAEEVWELGSPSFGPPAAHSPPNCWATDLDGFYPINCDVSLTSDWVTLPENPQLHFWHWYSIDELGWEGAFGNVEVSEDGETWFSASDESWYAGASDDWTPEAIDLSAWAGERVKIRFRLRSEEADIVIYYYAGWYVDDISISDVVPYGQGTLVLDRPSYSLNVPVVLTLIDGHLNTDPQSKETCLMTVFSSLDHVVVELVETDFSSGTFTGQVYLKEGPPVVGDEYLQVEPGDSIVAEYHDDDNGGGVPVDVVATAPLDTTPPLISDVTVSQVTDVSALVTWTTDVDAIGSVSYAESASGPFDRTLTESSYSAEHSAQITGLSENVAYYVKLSSTDRAGNVAVDDNGGGCYRLETMVRWEFFRDGFDRGDRGWTHQGLSDVWQWGKPQYGVMAAHSSSDCWATNLSGTYPGQIDASLISPPFELKEASQFGFWHWYGINEYLLDEGAGIVEIKPAEGQWQPLPEGSFSGATKSWEQRLFDLSAYGEQTVTVRFRLQAEQWIEFFYPGWYIDDVTLYCLRPFGFGVLQLGRQMYPLPGPVVITLKDGDLNLDTAAADTASVSVSSTSDASGRIIHLEETGENAGVFVGEVRLSLTEDRDGTGLRVRYGDTITISYTDADNALGETNVETFATAKVWSPPESPVLATVSYHPAPEPASATLTWPYEEGRAYRVYYCDDLLAEPPTWRRVSGTPKPLGPSSLTYSESLSRLAKKRFYRIQVW